MWCNIPLICASKVSLLECSMHALIYLCVEIGSDSLSLDVLWAMLVGMYLREIPVLVSGLFLHVYLPGVNILNRL